MFDRECAECGKGFQAKRVHAAFCATPCRQAFNNRAAMRGAELYHVMMTLRFNRDVGQQERLWSQACAMMSAYRDADKTLRDGRESWDKDAFKDTPLSYGRNGDKR